MLSIDHGSGCGSAFLYEKTANDLANIQIGPVELKQGKATGQC